MRGLLVGLSIATLAAAGAVPVAADFLCFAEEARLFASDGAPGDQFGASVALSGDTLLVGAPDEGGIGAAYVFVRSGAGWVEQAKLVPSSVCSGAQFGHAVAIDGDLAVVGAWFDDPICDTAVGSAFVFSRSGSAWTEEIELEGDPGDIYGYFGAAVAIEGETVFVGADFVNKVHVFERAGGAWPSTAVLQGSGGYFGNSLAVRDGRLVVGAPRTPGSVHPGRAHVFTRVGGGWVEEALLESPDDPGDSFGTTLSIVTDRLLVGAPRDEEAGGLAGAAYLYERDAGGWALRQKLLAPNGSPGDLFGDGVAISDRFAAVTSRFFDRSFEQVGGESVFVESDSGWVAAFDSAPTDSTVPTFFLRPVAIEGNTVVSGTSLGAGYVRVLVAPPTAGIVECTCAVGPCANSDPAAGCVNSSGDGAALAAQGDPATGDVSLLVQGAVPGQFGVFFQGDDASAAPFGDGILCAAGVLLRITAPPVEIGPDGSLAFGPCFGDPSIPSRTGVVPGSGETKRYQLWFRDPGGPCGQGFNLSSGLAITW